MDFFLWGYLKQKVYATEPNTVKTQRQEIVEPCELFSKNIYRIFVRSSTEEFITVNKLRVNISNIYRKTLN